MSSRKIAKNTLFQIIGKVVTAGTTLVVTMLVTRRFGPGGYGDYMIMVAFPGFFWIIVDFGFNAAAVREIVKDGNRARDYLGNLILVRLALAAVLTLLAGLVLKFLPYSPIVKLGITLNFISIFAYALFFSANAIFQSQLRYDLSARAVGSGALLSLALVGASLLLGQGPLALIGALVAGNLVMAGVALYQACRLVGLRRIDLDRKLVKSLVLATLPVGLAIIFNLLDFKIDSFMLSVLPLPRRLGLSNRATVGIYAAPFKILEVVLVLPTFFMNAVYPILVTRLDRP
ncbi:oligosaccharide flippase family protein, partial [Candidatus Parcubacteria bacterium]|nr:oligosaccharide flippase family protein [Candidatus Parcubacteria bacterium]